MVDRCINPQCREKMKFFYWGEVYSLETKSKRTEFFWLCSPCAVHFAVRLNPLGAVVCIPKVEVTNVQLPDQDLDLRLAFLYPSFVRSHYPGRPSRRLATGGEAL
jgi:hypothetical protein